MLLTSIKFIIIFFTTSLLYGVACPLLIFSGDSVQISAGILLGVLYFLLLVIVWIQEYKIKEYEGDE